MDQLRADLKEETKQKLAEQKEALGEKHQQNIKELKQEHEEEVKVINLVLKLNFLTVMSCICTQIPFRNSSISF